MSNRLLRKRRARPSDREPQGNRVAILRVATDNPLKVQAVRRACQKLGLRLVVRRASPPGNRVRQPRGWNRVFAMAGLRARSAGLGGVGLEAGLVRMRRVGWLNVAVCAVNEGKRLIWGMGPGYTVPPKLAREAAGGELGEAVDRMTGERLSKRKGGAVAALTGGRIKRLEILESAARMALGQLSLA